MNKLPCPRRRSGEVIVYDSLTSPTGTFETFRRTLRMSVYRGGSEVARRPPKNAQNCFLYRLLLVVVASTFGFQIYEIETEFLHAD